MQEYKNFFYKDKDLENTKLLKLVNVYEKLGGLYNQELLEATETIKKYKDLLETYQEELNKAKNEIKNLESRNFKIYSEIQSVIEGSKKLPSAKISTQRNTLEKEPGFYSDIFHVIANLDLDEKEAKFHWKKILEHSEFMSKQLGREISFRVAMLDYFIQNKILIKNPKIVEFETFEEITKNSFVDELTGICNRRFFNHSLLREIKRCFRHEKPLSLFVFDLDNFKTFNDTYGHDMGDKALQLVASVLIRNFRLEDTVARIGGEEFCVILPEANPKEALIPCKRFVNNLKEESKQKLPNTLTLSGGISYYPLDAQTPEELYIAADKYAYSAKKLGKDQIILTDKF